MKKLCHKFEDIISIENLLKAWQEFSKGKRNKPDVQEFSLRLMYNILQLQKHGNTEKVKQEIFKGLIFGKKVQ